MGNLDGSGRTNLSCAPAVHSRSHPITQHRLAHGPDTSQYTGSIGGMASKQPPTLGI